MVRKGIVNIEQVVGVRSVGRVGLRGALALVGLIHVTLLGCIVDLGVTTNWLNSETREPFRVPLLIALVNVDTASKNKQA